MFGKLAVNVAANGSRTGVGAYNDIGFTRCKTTCGNQKGEQQGVQKSNFHLYRLYGMLSSMDGNLDDY